MTECRFKHEDMVVQWSVRVKSGAEVGSVYLQKELCFPQLARPFKLLEIMLNPQCPNWEGLTCRGR